MWCRGEMIVKMKAHSVKPLRPRANPNHERPRAELGNFVSGSHGAAPSVVDLDTPLRLKYAVKIAFPMGGMTVSGLRKEIGRGRLEVEIIAGKQFTTLANIARMRELCLGRAKALDFGSDQQDGRRVELSPLRSGSSKIKDSISPQAALQARLTGNLR